MNSKLKWIISGAVYLLVIVIIYLVIAPDSVSHDQHTTTGSTVNEHHEHALHEEIDQTEEATIDVLPSYEEGLLTIQLRDQQGNAPTLALTHEKKMHAIIISTDLEEYYHVHPEEKEKGNYEISLDLPDNDYHAFIDMKPVNTPYSVQPIPLLVGEQPEHNHSQLTLDTSRTKEVDEYKVTMRENELREGEEVTLSFDLHGSSPETYLGALGHVVIVDENSRSFLHVHPVAEDKTEFMTTFPTPGRYKIWAEFQFDGQVRVFPYVVEVK